MAKYLFTSESVTEGHPDKICDQISDAVLDAIIAKDPQARVACETAVTTGMVLIMGEISTNCYVDIPAVARDVIRGIGYDRAKFGFDYATCAVLTSIDEQSGDIALGVDEALEQKQGAGDEADSTGAGDQGMMFGYASDDTPELMPMPISLAHRLAKRLSEVRHDGTLPYLRPDGKTQVTVEYEDDAPVRVDAVVISNQHSPDVSLEQIRADVIAEVIDKVIPSELMDDRTKIYVNPTGRFVIGGAHRPQDHRRHLRRLRPARRRRLLGQGPDQGGPLGGLRRALGGEEHCRRQARPPLRGAGGLRDRRGEPRVGQRQHLRHRRGA